MSEDVQSIDDVRRPDKGVITLNFRYNMENGEVYEVPVTVAVHSTAVDLSLRALQDAGRDETLHQIYNSFSEEDEE